MKSIFKGKHVKVVYKFDKYVGQFAHYPYILKETEVIKYETILETELDTPPLEDGDQFYLIKEDKVVTVKKALRGTDNVMVYLTDVVLSTEEELEESLKQAINERDEYLIKQKDEDEKYQQQKDARDYRNKYEDTFFIKRFFMRKPE